MFRLLGWDIDNAQGGSALYREVIHEDTIKIGSAIKAPDYCFRVGGKRKFFIEAKRPSVNIDKNLHAALQVRRYAWTANLSLSVLTDFEEFSIYDTRVKPQVDDDAKTARVNYWKFEEYPDHWSEIEEIFHRENVISGSFDRYIGGIKTRKGTKTVDESFLDEMESWREQLAVSMAVSNPGLSQRELNFAVQRIIDRIVFLRICEDRGIEPYGQLQLIQKKADIYQNELVPLFHQADQKYNSGLFHFSDERGRATVPDRLTSQLSLDDKVLQSILNGLYYPVSPYEFSVMPAEILGHVYERFLGSVISLTDEHKAKVEQKPEVRKAGGVYYTPSYIVDYIVKQTVGKLLEDKTPKEISGMKVCDISCGSGSFLIGAYQFLLDWYRDYYHEKGSKQDRKLIYQGSGGEWRLTTDERKRILLDHIYGVDIDPQAVETTKLSLLLKVLEGENEQTLQKQLEMFKKRALPDLGSNIKCGNSLVGTDFYQGEQLELIDEETEFRVNAFDWSREFPNVFKGSSPGFDAIIGNPPYVRQELLGDYKEYFKATFKTFSGVADLYTYFIERGHDLMKEGGRFGYIVSNKWLRANYGQALRQWMKRRCIESILDFGDQHVFGPKVSAYPCILFLRKGPSNQAFHVTPIKTLDFLSLDDYAATHTHDVSQDTLEDSSWSLSDNKTEALLQKLKAVGVPLGEYVDGKIYRGVLTGLNEAFIIDSETREFLIAQDPKSAELIKPFLVGKDIKRYQHPESRRYLIFMPKGWTDANSDMAKDAWIWLKKSFPAIAGHLEPFTGKGEKRYDKGNYWWELRACDYYHEFEKGKILWPEIAQEARFALDENGFYLNNKAFLIPTTSLYVFGLLNSLLLKLYIHSQCTDLQGDSYNFSGVFLKTTPIRPVDFTNQADKAKHDKMVNLVQTMLDLNKRLKAARTHDEARMLERRIAATDHGIDLLVYDLYGLTAEEIAIVEGSSGEEAVH